MFLVTHLIFIRRQCLPNNLSYFLLIISSFNADNSGLQSFAWFSTPQIQCLFPLLFKLEDFNHRVVSFENDMLIYFAYFMYVSGWNRFGFYCCYLWGGAWRMRNEVENRRRFIVNLMVTSSVIWKAAGMSVTELLIHNIFIAAPSCFLHSNQRVKMVTML